MDRKERFEANSCTEGGNVVTKIYGDDNDQVLFD